MKIDELIKISINNNQQKMLYYVCENILEYTNNPKIIVVVGSSYSYRRRN